jgi:SulP family sulfate permease
LVLGLGIETKTVADIASISGGFHILILLLLRNLANNFSICSNYGFGRINRGLLTINLVDEITGTRGNGNRECIAQGSQYFKWFFSSMGGCPMIAQTLVICWF